ncbi:Uu.00g099330.m01.CDS01 [Anthostomella pinea]|uniref:Uu.00g099330.m01.CDS01 n=1 Tax=Anthostomella pinea TaxID=933095 RepID=A0AAI8VCM8_9PEZI|nr:Uu.00g099330.m01.CDS01 [Anthostomella pinea]
MAALSSILRLVWASMPYYAAIALVTYLLLFTTYQIFLHPLSRYPGPLLAKLSNAYNGFYAHQKCLHLVTRQNQLKYGPVVRQGPNKLVFNSISALQDIYKNDRITKPRSYQAVGPGRRVPNMFATRDKKLHRARRQVVGQILTDRSLQAFEPTMIEQVDIFISQLLASAQSTEPVNMSIRTRQLGMDIAGLLSFGYEFNLQTTDEHRFMFTTLDGQVPSSNVYFNFYSLRPWVRWITMLLVGKTRERTTRLMEKIVTTRMALEKDARHDLYSFVAHALDAKSGGLRQSELWAEAQFFLTAAGETTKTTISAAVFYLSRNPEVYEKLAHEIRSAFTNGGEINGAALTSCRYLRACIDESLRMSPPVSGILWRERAPDENDSQPLVVDGHVIPPGTVVGVNTYSLHHNEEYFPDPFAFNPERWLDSSTPEAAKLVRNAFIPFSVGSRACAGKSMAYKEISLVLAKTLLYFDFNAAPGKLGDVGAGNPDLGPGRERPGEFQLYDNFSSSHDGPYLTFRSRGDFGKDLSR